MKKLFFFLLCLGSLPTLAQEIADKSIFSYEQFISIVRNNHPVLQQADLLSQQAEASLLNARGAFDPKLEAEHEHKQFSNKNYFRTTELGVKIPTWWGATVKASYNWANGDFLNPEAYLPSNGQAVIGVELPLLNGLLFDKRREQVQQAQLLVNLNEIERQKITNNLLLSAIEAYWEWVYAYQEYLTFNNFKDLASDRLEISKQNFFQGMKPAIDTLESYIQLQDRTLNEQQALQNFSNKGLALSVFLWNEKNEPLELIENSVPTDNKLIDTVFKNSQFAELKNLINEHPEIRILEIKNEQILLKERLKKEALKPDLNLSYNFLGKGFNFVNAYENEGIGESILTNNYKWGIQFSYPILMRKTRGDLQLLQLKQQEIIYKLNYKKLSINNKAKALIEQLTLTEQQLKEQEQIIINYERLLDAENIKFSIGESSIFLLNSREQKLINAQLKRFKQVVLFNKSKSKLKNILGLLN